MYNFQAAKDPYGYSLEDEDEEDEEPLWAAKAVKKQGVGMGLGKGKSFSSGIGFSQTSQQQQMAKTGGSFYGGQQKQSDPYANYAQTSSGGFYGQQQQQPSQPVKQSSQPAKQSSQGGGLDKKTKKGGKDFVAKRFGLNYNPPTISKLYHHKIKLKKLQTDSEIEDAIDYIKKKHATFFMNDQISDDQLYDLIEKLQTKMKLGQQPPKKFGQTPQQPQKQQSQSKVTSQPAYGTQKSQPAPPTSVAKSQPLQKQSSYLPESDPESDPDGVDYENYNLNKLSNEELKKHKDKMEVVFIRNSLRPGDAGYVYDKQEDFGEGNESNEWDMDEDNDMDIV